MKKIKTEIKFFSVPQWKKEEEYLRQQHKNGWEFIGVNGLCLYHFQKCEPKDVVYQLDYNPDSVYKKDEYIQIFSDCGWEYLQNYFGYSYFRKTVSDMGESEEEIFCDDASRLEMMKRVFKGRMIPLLIIFFMIIIPQIVAQSQNGTPLGRFMLILYCILLVMYIAAFIAFAIPFWKYYNSTHKE